MSFPSRVVSSGSSILIPFTNVIVRTTLAIGVFILLILILTRYKMWKVRTRENKDFWSVDIQIALSFVSIIFNINFEAVWSQRTVFGPCHISARLIPALLILTRILTYTFLIKKTEVHIFSGKVKQRIAIGGIIVLYACLMVASLFFTRGTPVYLVNVNSNVRKETCEVSYSSIGAWIIGFLDLVLNSLLLYHFIYPLTVLRKRLNSTTQDINDKTVQGNPSLANSADNSNNSVSEIRVKGMQTRSASKSMVVSSAGDTMSAVIRRNFISGVVTCLSNIISLGLTGLTPYLTSDYSIIIFAVMAIAIDLNVNSISLLYCTKTTLGKFLSMYLSYLPCCIDRQRQTSTITNRKVSFQPNFEVPQLKNRLSVDNGLLSSTLPVKHDKIQSRSLSTPNLIVPVIVESNEDLGDSLNSVHKSDAKEEENVV